MLDRRYMRRWALAAAALTATVVLAPVAAARPAAAPVASAAVAAAPGYIFRPQTCGRLRTASGSFTDNPDAIAINPLGTAAIAVNDALVQKVEIRTNPVKVLGSTTAASGDSVVIHPNGAAAYVVDAAGSTLSVLDIRATAPRLVRKVFITGLEDAAVTKNGKYLFVRTGIGYQESFDVYAIGAGNTFRLVRSVPLGGYGLQSKMLMARSSRWVVIGNDNGVMLLQTTDPLHPRILSRKIALPFEPGAMTFDQTEQSLYVGSTGPGRYARIDVVHRAVVGNRDMRGAGTVLQLAVSRDNKLIYALTNVDETMDPFYVLDRVSAVAIFRGGRGGTSYPGALVVSQYGPTLSRSYFATDLDSGPVLCGYQAIPVR